MLTKEEIEDLRRKAWGVGFDYKEQTIKLVVLDGVTEMPVSVALAAPELLEALRGMLRVYGAEEWGGDETLAEVKAARAAIAKAEVKP